MYRKRLDGWLKHFDFILLDLACLQLAFILSYIFRHGMRNPYDNILYRNMSFFLMLASLLIIFFCETFKDVLKRGYYIEFAATVKQVILVELLAVLYLFTSKESGEYSRITLYVMGILYVFLSYAVRLLWKKMLRSRKKERVGRSLLIVTTTNMISNVIANIQGNNYEMFNIAGVVVIDKDMTGKMMDGIPIVAGSETVVNYICREWIDEVLVIPSSEFAFPEALMKQFMETGVTVHLNLAEISKTLGKKQLVETVGNYTVLTTSLNYATVKQAFMKRAIDIVGGVIGCILAGIIFIFVAPVIYFQSPGPIIFSQTRVGKNGKKFKMYKFRSMYMDAEERKKDLMKDNRVKDGRMFKMKFDPRVIGNKILPNGEQKTGIGNFLRVTSLDEFPQFYNVLKGDMSLVGTRPPTVDEFALYEGHHRARLAVKPGITGMWQVSGRSDIIDFEEVVKLDTKYISEWSMGLDFKILLKTVAVIFKKEGSM